AWSWTQREHAFGMPPSCDRLEGWIADPASSRNHRPAQPSRPMFIDSQTAIETARSHAIPAGQCRVQKGWPAGAYRTAEDDRVWTVYLPSQGDYVGGDRVVVVSQRTGKVLFSGLIGE